MSTRFKPYPNYKDLGVEWLGQIPHHWKINPLKRYARVRYGLGQPPPQFPDGSPLIRATNINSGKITEKDMLRVDPNEVPESREATLAVGEIIVVRSGAYTGDSAIVPHHYAGAIAGYDMVVSVRSGFSPYFAWQFLSSEVRQLQFGFHCLRAAQPHLNAEELLSTVIVIPPVNEQQAIASFLDRETAKIDALVKKKERLIELLQEKRTALISHAVTQGLTPNVPKKDSGIPWIGWIPKHWEVKRLAVIASKITNGFVGPTRDILVDEGTRYLQSLHIKDGEVLFDTPYYVRPQWSKEHAKSILVEGDVLIVQTGALVGQCCSVPQEFEGANCHALIIVRLQRGLGSGLYLSAFLRSHYGRATLRCCETGATLPHLECGKIREIQISLPPADEQVKIIDYLDRETDKLDALISKVRLAIERLQEYRTALISAAVTGQIDVRKESQS